MRLCRRISFSLILALIIGWCVGCGNVSEPTTVPTTQSQQTEPSTTAPVTYVDYDIPAESILNRIPKFRYGEFVEIRDLDASGEYFLDAAMKTTVVAQDALGGGEMIMFSEISDDSAYCLYAKDLEADGFSKYAENELAGNQYATWVSDLVYVTVMYLPNYERIHIIAEPKRDLPAPESENVYQDLGVENRVAMISTQFVGRQNGMCILFQLCDGSFIIVDSGFGMGFDKKGEEFADYWKNNAREIYHTLEKLAIDRDRDGDKDEEDIVIAAWFFTHPHWDHIGGFMPFSELYGDDVTVEQVIVNLPNAETHTAFIDGKLKAGLNADANGTYIGRIQDAVAEFKGAKYIEAHPGQKYYIRDAVVDMLYTWELERAMIDRMNSASLVFTVELGETRTTVLGDCGPSSSKVLTDLYGDFLESDFQTVAHHGYVGATRKLNATIDADIVLWPVGRQDFVVYQQKDYNMPFGNAEANYCAGDKVIVIPLPYTSDADVQVWDVVEKIYGQN